MQTFTKWHKRHRLRKQRQVGRHQSLRYTSLHACETVESKREILCERETESEGGEEGERERERRDKERGFFHTHLKKKAKREREREIMIFLLYGPGYI